MTHLSRRTFLLAAGVSWMLPGLPFASAAASKIVVLDAAFREHAALLANTRITLLDGDAGWLWHEHLIHEAMQPMPSIIGLTRYADAFVLTQFAAQLGLRTTQRTLDAQRVTWRIDRLDDRNAR
ncbi:hypothetical protein BVER_01021c [Candidatus Burkholderia verschuerenii]|uniref:Uncharacterized protein n=1 Tax=Candidatus Burkholderia verschuerenii TaxID=242163 RepID=A0A0L0MFQ2_9BURK|nr:hypothetical protein [Candidatus Burkholderia verschuerenii]KND60804.1 hypothetical protein BVER_01021c [Candidatus Burkholderia verschuerenii]